MIVQRVFKPETAAHQEIAIILGKLILENRESSHSDVVNLIEADSGYYDVKAYKTGEGNTNGKLQ